MMSNEMTCEVSCPPPCAYSRSLEPCVASCGDSRAVVFPPPVLLTFPGPTLSTCSQESVVGASHPAILGDPIPNFSRQSYGMGSSFGSGGFPASSSSTFGVGGGSFGVGGGSFGMQNSRGGYGAALGIRGSLGSGGAFGGSRGFGGSSYGRRSCLGSWGSS